MLDHSTLLRHTAALAARVDRWRKGKVMPSGKPISRAEAFRQLIERGLSKPEK